MEVAVENNVKISQSPWFCYKISAKSDSDKAAKKGEKSGRKAADNLLVNRAQAIFY